MHAAAVGLAAREHTHKLLPYKLLLVVRRMVPTKPPAQHTTAGLGRGGRTSLTMLATAHTPGVRCSCISCCSVK